MTATGKKEELQKAGAFHIQQLEIITSKGVVVDLLGALVHVTFFEDIQSTSITGSCIINDQLDISTIGPVIGQEYLRMKITTSGLNAQESSIDFTKNLLLVNSLTTKEEGASGNQFLVLEFSTSELQRDQRIRINQSYSGSYSDIFKEIMVDQLGSRKKLYVEPSSGLKKIVFPNFSPFEAINMMKRQAVSEHDGSPTYMFYEDFKGYHFRSLSSMYAEPAVFTYKTSVAGSNPNDPVSDLSIQSSRVAAGHPEGFFEAFANIYTEFADAITSSKKTNYTFPSIEDGVKGMKFMFAAKESSNKNSKWIKL